MAIMNIKQYLKENKISVSSLHKQTGIPYTSISEIVNGKVNIDRVYTGTAIRLADSCGLEFAQFYRMCRENIPKTPKTDIIVKNKKYYLRYDIEGETGCNYLCKANETNKRYVKDFARWELDTVKNNKRLQKEIEEVESWPITT